MSLYLVFIIGGNIRVLNRVYYFMTVIKLAIGSICRIDLIEITQSVFNNKKFEIFGIDSQFSAIFDLGLQTSDRK